MKCITSAVLLGGSIAAFAATAVVDKLPMSSTVNHPKEVILMTQNIHDRAAVTVYCEVTLPHYYKSTFNFYVVPQAGDFGDIEGRYNVAHMSAIPQKSSELQVIGSKIYTTNSISNNSSELVIRQVTKSNEAIIFDFSTMPNGTTASCSY